MNSVLGKDGNRYKLIKRLGRGGQAQVWEVVNINNNKHYAYKKYKRDINGVRSNIENLAEIGVLKDKNGVEMQEVVLPITMVEGEKESFGYIMDLVNLKNYTTIKKAWAQPSRYYPSCRSICRIVNNIARVFEALHNTYGMCYKDINEGNIFFNPITGDVRIIDNDNIGYASKTTILGTPGYRAPEVVLGGMPDHNSDKHSLAVFIYRLLTGGFPFDGPKTTAYCTKNNESVYDAERVVYGSEALFTWNPKDKRNALTNSKDPQKAAQAKIWKNLPEDVKKLFISAFAINLPEDRKAERPGTDEWIKIFSILEKNLIKCPYCGREVYKEAGMCFECFKSFKRKKTKAEKATLAAAVKGNSPTSSKEHKHRVVFKVLSIGEVKCEKQFYPGDVVKSKIISKNLSEDKLFEIKYNKKEKKIGIRNLTTFPWTLISENKNKIELKPLEIQPLENRMKVRIIPKTVQLNVLKIE